MVTKHFLKTLVIFMVLIIVGLIGVFVVGYFDDSSAGSDSGVQATAGE
ncbi:MAG: hypothetical protein WDN09_00035 [bacterium]